MSRIASRDFFSDAAERRKLEREWKAHTAEQEAAVREAEQQAAQEQEQQERQEQQQMEEAARLEALQRDREVALEVERPRIAADSKQSSDRHTDADEVSL